MYRNLTAAQGKFPAGTLLRISPTLDRYAAATYDSAVHSNKLTHTVVHPHEAILCLDTVKDSAGFNFVRGLVSDKEVLLNEDLVEHFITL